MPSPSLSPSFLQHSSPSSQFSKKASYTFSLFSYLILHQDNSLLFHICSLLIQTFQLMSFTFSTTTYTAYWKSPQITQSLQLFLRYFCVLPFFSGNFALYAIGFVLACVIIATYTTLLVYSIVSLNRSASLSFYGHSALRLITRTSTYMFNVFYLPLLNVLLSIYNCDATTGMNVHSSDSDSNSGNSSNSGNAIYKGDATYIAFCVLSAVFTVVLTTEKYMYTILCYEHIYNRNNIISKQTSEPERIAMLIQVFVVFMNEIWKNELLFIVCYMLLTLLLLCKYKSSIHLYNYTMSKLNMCYAMMLTCNAVSFFIARISYTTHFNGNIMLFVLSIIISVIALLCFYEDDYSIVTINTRSEHVNDAKRGYIAIAKINDVIKQVNKNKRKERMILESYIHSYELTCATAMNLRRATSTCSRCCTSTSTCGTSSCSRSSRTTRTLN